jgi:hypothetical protein
MVCGNFYGIIMLHIESNIEKDLERMKIIMREQFKQRYNDERNSMNKIGLYIKR